MSRSYMTAARRLIVATALAACAALTVAHAQDDRRAALAFVTALTEAGLTAQLARWDKHVCVLVTGFAERQNERLKERILALGATVSLRPSSAGCSPSIIVVATPNAAGIASEFADTYGPAFKADGVWRLERFQKSDRPVRWLTVTDPCGRGCTLRTSRIRVATEPTLKTMVIVLDANQIAGHSLGEMADYVAFVALANPSLDEAIAEDSILALFRQTPEQAGQSKIGLTARDCAFLHGFYVSPTDLGIDAQRTSIADRISRRLGSDGPNADGECAP